MRSTSHSVRRNYSLQILCFLSLCLSLARPLRLFIFRRKCVTTMPTTDKEKWQRHTPIAIDAITPETHTNEQPVLYILRLIFQPFILICFYLIFLLILFRPFFPFFFLSFSFSMLPASSSILQMRNQIRNVASRLQWGHLNVVVPPDILNEADTNGSSLDESVTNEGGQIQLVCIATGVPEPTVSEMKRCRFIQESLCFLKNSF